tara:strand:+ start:654 stop:779 length:126 start_codon:yes stop_codon:yes gene_type:complete
MLFLRFEFVELSGQLGQTQFFIAKRRGRPHNPPPKYWAFQT